MSCILLVYPISENLEDRYKDLIRNRLYIFVQINLDRCYSDCHTVSASKFAPMIKMAIARFPNVKVHIL